MIVNNLSFQEKEAIIKNFPNVKLSYENIIHNKVVNNKINYNYDLYLAIPCGKKCFAWFTIYNDENVCFIMELMENKIIYNIKIFNCIFNNDLVYGNGTILYGTHFNFKQNNFFSIENIFFSKGNDLTNLNWYDKFSHIKKLFISDIQQISYNKKYIVFGMPLLSNNFEELKKNIGLIEYKLYSIQFRNFSKTNSHDTILYKNFDINKLLINLEIKPKITEIVKPNDTKEVKEVKQVKETNKEFVRKQIVFKIKPDIQNDIYHLYCLNGLEEIYYKVAYIPDYKTSVMMNKLFRNIKENENLDLLEESDDEEEFQNDKEDRFVHLDTSYNMICNFNYKFKKWYPVSLAPVNLKIIQQNELSKYDKK
jgi:hypothetical protein